MRNHCLTGRSARAILLSLVMIAATASPAQFTVQIGTTVDYNDSITYPAPYGNQAFGTRHQWLYLASELAAAGLVPNCSITGLALGVHDTGAVDLTGFTISMKNTFTTEFATAAFEATGLTQVWGPYDVDDQLGWNQHDLDIPFAWDGVSNLLVQTCYGNGSGSYNAEMYHSVTTFNSVVYRATANANVCTSALGLINISPLRPTVQLTWSPPMIPPVAAFTSGNPLSCSATVAFTDLSDYAPTGWSWDFGDGTTDTVQNPVHTFPGDGSYVVTLIDTNAYGADTAVANITINSAGLLPALACIPYASDSLAGNGLANVSYLGVSFSSGHAGEGYQDRTCVNDTTQLGNTFTLTAEASGPAPQRMAAWIDWNNDAAFTAGEQVLDAIGISVSATVSVPASAVLNTPLRVRVMADDTTAAALSPCVGPLYGQAEDYAVVVLPIVDPPVAAFSADELLSCDGVVAFTDLSSNLPSDWSWDFGDGSALDTTQNPIHTFTGTGVFTVSLIASNPYGSDTLTQINLITVAAPGTCDTLITPDGAGGTNITATTCTGILVDDGGPSANYTPGTSAAVTIAPIGAATVTLTFSLFEFDTGGAGDFLAIYDGPDILSPLIGAFTGSGVGVLPGGGVITSTGPSITIQQQCTAGTGVDQGFLLNWQCTPDTVPPVAAFTPSTTFSCTGTISFTDASSGEPTAWSWDFGDGSPLDSTQNPSHTYLTDGSFTVTLTATNAYGSSSTSQVVSVNTGGAVPPPACIPTATGAVAGIGIAQVSYGAIVNNSGDAFTEGYLDLTCMNDTFLVCTPLTLSVQATASGFQHNIAAWVDWDNNGLFGSGEQILSATNTTSATVTLQIPASAALGTPLRLRVMADLNVSPPLAACNNPLYGQAEDYSVIVMANPNPPAAAFSLVPTPTCDGTVQFTDESLNCPTGWEWDFGDASPVDNTQDPIHTYAASGTYDVTLIATNAIGSDTLVMVAAVTVDLAGQLLPAACTPQTVGYLANYGLLNFTFAGINSTSVDGIEGYQDRSCGNTATVQEGTAYQLDAILGGDAQPDMFVWIDFDNNGAFAAGELVFSSAGTHTPSASVTIPLGSVYNTPVRLRVSTDVAGNITTGCTQPQYGQTEDFACVVLQNTDPPVAAFSASPLSSCDGVVDFTDLSTNLPTGWTWDFGDGSPTDNTQNPTHTYTGIGTYTVSLTATNGFGSDTDVQVDLITVVDPAFCDTVLVPNGPGGPGGGTDTTVTDCFGVVTDDGGPINNYTPGYSSALTIAPPGAQWVTLTFSQFEFDAGVGGGGTGGTPDSLWIFDGPDIFSPAIGWWTGYGVGVLPNSGVITSSGGSITLQQRCTGGGMSVDLGFIANWNCSLTGVDEQATTDLRVWPQPSTGEVNIGFSRGAVAGERIVVNDALGRIVMVEELTPGTRTMRMDLSTFGAGCYSLSLQGEAGRWTRSIILN